MFREVLSLGPGYLGALAFSLLILLFAWRRITKDYAIRQSKAGGVRAPVLATNPLTGMYLGKVAFHGYCACLNLPQACGSSWMPG